MGGIHHWWCPLYNSMIERFIVRIALPSFLALVLSSTGCHVATGDGYFGGFTVKTGLFMEYATSTNLNGSGSFLFSDGEVTCDDLETGLESGSMWRETEDQNGVYGTLTYQLTEDPDQDPWIGAYGSGYVYDYNSDGTASYRGAASNWFNAEGHFAVDSTGLIIEVEDSTGDNIKGYLWHVWDEFSFNAEHCGSYGT